MARQLTSLSGKHYLVTGGASGLGLAAATYLAADKNALVTILDFKEDDGPAAAKEVCAKAKNNTSKEDCCQFVFLDVNSEESMEA